MSNILFLITHFSLKRQTFLNYKMSSHERLKNIVNQKPFFSFWTPFFYFETYLFWTLLVVLRHPYQRARRVISDWMVLEVNTQERMSLEQTNQWPTLTFRWKLNKQRCVSERMRDKDVKVIHYLAFVIMVYNNGINLEILMSH